MSINTYADLKTSIVSWLDINTSDVSSVIDDLVTLGETRISREAQSKDNEAALATTVVGGVAAIPADYQMLKFAYLNTSPVQALERRSAEWIYERYPDRTVTGKTPIFIAREGTNFIFGPYLDSGYVVTGVYFKNMPALSTSAHALFITNPDLYLFACLAESEILIGRDSRIALWEAKYQKILNDLNNLDDTEAISGSHLEVRTA